MVGPLSFSNLSKSGLFAILLDAQVALIRYVSLHDGVLTHVLILQQLI